MTEPGPNNARMMLRNLVCFIMICVCMFTDFLRGLNEHGIKSDLLETLGFPEIAKTDSSLLLNTYSRVR